MSLSIRCDACAKPLRVKAELAGKRIKCPGCGQVVAVPKPEEAAAPWWQGQETTPQPVPKPEQVAAAPLSPPAPTSPESDPLIRTACQECGRLLHVKKALAGKRIKCPHCSSLQTVPQEEQSPAWGMDGGQESSGAGVPLYLETYLARPEKAWDVLVAALSKHSACEVLTKDRTARQVTFRMTEGGLLVTVVLSGDDRTEAALVFDDSQVPEAKLAEVGQLGKGLAVCKDLPVRQAGKVLLQTGAKAVVLTALDKAGKRIGGPAEQAANKNAGVLRLVIGLLLLGFGLVATAVSHESASAGGTYSVFYGAIIMGAVLALAGAYGMVTGRDVS